MLSRLNPRGVAKNLVMIKAKRFIAEYCDGIGQDRLRWMIREGKQLREFVTEEQIAIAYGMTVEEFRGLRRQWAWVSNLVGDEDFVKVLPDWVMLEIQAHKHGKQWLDELVLWIRWLVCGG